MLKGMTKLTFRCFILFIILVGIGVYFFVMDRERRSVKLTSDTVKVVLSEEEWTKNDLKLTIEFNNASRYIKGYSFDGGKTWTKRNTLDINENKDLKIAVKDINNYIYSIDYKIDNIDKEGPIIKVADNIQVNRGSKINLTDYITVVDNQSGLRDEVVITPSTINTNVLGTYTVQIYAIDKMANKTISTMNINVVNNAPIIEEQSISLNYNNIEISINEENKLIASISPKYATNKAINWTSSDPSIVRVDSNGQFIGVASGTATITATTSNGLTDTCNVVVK